MKPGKNTEPAGPSPRQIATLAAVALLGGLASVGILWWDSRTSSSADPNRVIVYKDPSCECCGRWVKHLRDAGFTVEVQAEFDLDARNRELGIPKPLAACHTALVDGYLIEGHVPASDIRRLLTERPSARGLAVPGMPVGSPGMEIGDRQDPYDVVLFDATGKQQVFSHHGAAAPVGPGDPE